MEAEMHEKRTYRREREREISYLKFSISRVSPHSRIRRIPFPSRRIRGFEIRSSLWPKSASGISRQSSSRIRHLRLKTASRHLPKIQNLFSLSSIVIPASGISRQEEGEIRESPGNFHGSLSVSGSRSHPVFIIYILGSVLFFSVSFLSALSCLGRLGPGLMQDSAEEKRGSNAVEATGWRTRGDPSENKKFQFEKL